MKLCTRCHVEKDEADFNHSSRSHDGMQAYCRACQSRHYRDNAVRHGANVRRTSSLRMARMREIVVAAMAQGCVDCGNEDIRVLEFDHVRGAKTDSIGRMVRIGASVDALRQEIAKCEVRCRNCHALATLSRLKRSWHGDYLL